MAEVYLYLNPTDLARVFQPYQQVEVNFSRTVGEENRFKRIKSTAVIVSMDEQTMVLELPKEDTSWYSILKPNRYITIHTGRDDKHYTFKSKIRQRELKETSLWLTIDTPRIMASKERRSGPRVPLIIPINYRILKFKGLDLEHVADKIGFGESQNLSNGGITLLTDLMLPVGMILTIDLNVDGKTVSLAGIVRRVQPVVRVDYSYAVGIQFANLKDEHQDLLEKAVSKNSKKLKGGLFF